MDYIAALLAFGVPLGLAMLLVLIVRRMGWTSGEDRRSVSTGVAAWLGELNEMLQPNQASVEVIARMHEDEYEQEGEDEGESKEPGTGPQRNAARGAPGL